ncbi:hypothetical protein [Acetobacter conturbans]|uniref:NADH:quinone oxidoreductase/Mrp antiporter membrane subunit domain-containing protein n=1 Tax=Acetobacter conturbans TaxID=1737472 RepID=A0ABX0JXI0_9PROT|nr:hypothetical protein [Acetobacter conturbans]NHN87175.1 hypothetical protein [Acetobacter conturbans]
MPVLLAGALSATPERWIGLPPGQQRLACQSVWLVAAACAFAALPWSESHSATGFSIPGFRFDSAGSLFLIVFATIGCCAERWVRPGGRLPLASAAACLAALADHPASLMVTGSTALMLALPGRRNAAAGCLRALLFAAACAPGPLPASSPWMAVMAALLCATGEGRRTPDCAVAPLLEAGCGVLVLCRALLRPETIATPGMTALLLGGGMCLALCRIAIALTTPRGSRAIAGLAMLPVALAIMALGLLMLAMTEGSILTAHAAASVLTLDLITLWPIAAAFLCAGGLVTEGAGSDHLGRLGGLILFAPRLSGLLAVALLALTLLPPTGGFSVLWLLVETALGLLPDGFTAALPSLTFLLGLGVIVALSGLAVLRLTALLLLGSARSPRMAACPDATWIALFPVLGTLLFACLTACVPGGVLRLTTPFLTRLTGGETDAPRPPLFTLVGPDGLSSWMPLGVTVLLLLILLAIRLLQEQAIRARRSSTPARRDILPGITAGETVPWLGGLPTREPHLPFGEPLIWSGLDMAPSSLKAVLFPVRTLPFWRRAGLRHRTGRTLRRLRTLIALATPLADYGAALVLVLAALALCLTVLPS